MRKKAILVIITILSIKAGAQSSALVLGDSLYASGNYSKAIASYKSIANPSSKTLLQIARAYKANGVKGTALKYYKKSILKDSLQPIAQLEYGRLLLSKLKYYTADTVFTSLTKQYPDNPEYHYQLGKSLKLIRIRSKTDSTIITSISRSRFPKTAFAKAVQLDSTHQNAMYELSKIYLEEKEYPTVTKITNKALESDPENIQMIGLQAQNYYYKGWWSKAIEKFEQLIKLGQSTAFIHEKLGRSYYQNRKYVKAIAQYETLLTFEDENWEIHLTLSRLYALENDLEKSLIYAEKALYYKDQPLDDVYFTLGRTYQFKKDYKQAIFYFTRAIRENPKNSDARYALAVAADNFYENKTEVLKLYEAYLDRLGEQREIPYNAKLAALRINDLKQQIFMEKD